VGRKLRILDFDTESRPLNYVGPDFTYGELTAIAAGWADEEEVDVWVLTKDDRSRPRMYRAFKKLYDQADMVTGHFIRSHDLRRVNGGLIELGLEPLGPKLACDTKNDLVKFTDVGKSQEDLAGLFGVEAPKVSMNKLKWRSANRLSKAGIELTKLRCVGDVIQHKALRLALVERDLLSPPKTWHPEARWRF
jgi:hypothetical protein